MSKWFESKNLANYAKTALLQAQKQIDKVLDIKEEEILGGKPVASTTPSLLQEELTSNHSPSGSTISLSSSSKPSNESVPPKVNLDGDTFFSTFLNQFNTTTTNSSSRSSSPALANNNDDQSNRRQTRSKTSSTTANAPTVTVIKQEEPISFDSFVNKDDLQQQSATQDESDSSIFNLKSASSNSFSDQETPNNNRLTKLARTSSSSSSKTLKSQADNIDKNEKKTWVQNYVDSDGTTSGINETTNMSSFSIPVIPPASVSTSQEDDSNNTVVNDAITSEETNKATTESCHSSNNNETLASSDATDQLALRVSTAEDFKVISFNESVDQSIIQVEESCSPVGDDEKKTKLESDYVKIDGGQSSVSNNSQSGNASSNEEQETCASSDIEVISLPSNSGDQLLALKQKNLINKQQTINSSSSSSSASKKLKPTETCESKPNLMYVKSPPPNEPDQTTAALLEAREQHILKLNKQTVKLQEENDNLQSELEKLRFESVERFKAMQQAQNEVSTRCEQFCLENEKMKKINLDLSAQFVEFQKMIKEKDEQIEQLKQEGIKLSKQELNQSNIIKKLRSKEKENEEILAQLRNDFQKSQKELDELKKVLDLKEEAEKQNLDAFKKLEKGASYLEKELINTRSALEDAQEKVTGLENTLQNTFKELAELHRQNAAKDSRINEATSSIESQYKEEIQAAVEKERLIANKKQETLKWELQSVRSDISRLEHQHGLREDMLRKEIADLQKQLRDTEIRYNELSQNISTATRPLLRQIENLQASHSSQIELLENAERNLIERLKEAQAQCCELSEKNRANKEQLIEMSQQVKTYEVQIQSLKGEKSKLNAEYQLLRANMEKYENEKFEREAQNKVTINSLNQQVDKLIKEKKSLEAQLDMEKLKVENDSKKLQNLMNELAKERELQHQLQQKQLMNASTSSIESNSTPTAPTTPTGSSFSRRVSSNQLEFNSNVRYELLQQASSGSTISILESLQSKLKQKEGEINHLQKEIQNLERVKESMAKELVSLSNRLENMQQQLKDYPSLQEKFNKLNLEYNALLQMYGEKSEETEELKLDLQDVKEMYRLQIEDLIKRSSLS